MDELCRVIHRSMVGAMACPRVLGLLPRLPGHALVAKISRVSHWYGCVYDGSTGDLIMAHLSNAYQNDKHFFGTAELYMVLPQEQRAAYSVETGETA